MARVSIDCSSPGSDVSFGGCVGSVYKWLLCNVIFVFSYRTDADCESCHGGRYIIEGIERMCAVRHHSV